MPALTRTDKLAKALRDRQTKEAQRQADEATKQRTLAADLKAAHRAEHEAHLWRLARLLDAVGLAVYDVDTLRPWFKDLATRMEHQETSQDPKESPCSLA